MHRASPVRKLLTLAGTLLLVALAALAITGCSNEEQAIRTTIDNTLATFQNPTEESLRGLVGDDEYDEYAEQYAQIGTTPEELFQHVSGSLTYTIDDVTVDGDTATATLTVTNKDVMEVATTIQEEYSSGDKRAEAQQIYLTQGQDALVKAIMQDFYDQLDATTDTTTTTVTLDLTKTDGTWDVDDSSIDDFTNAFFGSDVSELMSE